MTLIDNFTKEELQQMANSSVSISELSKKLGYKSCCYKQTIQTKFNELGISLDHFTGMPRKTVKRTPENTFIKNSDASQVVVRRMYKEGEYSEYRCAICGLEPIWNEKPLTFTLDHINGINNDDRLENLRWVCPNCDRQLDTFGSKNPNAKHRYNKKKKNYCIDCGEEIGENASRCVVCAHLLLRKVERPTKEELNQLLLSNQGNFTQVGNIYGVIDNTIRKWCRGYGLPTKTADYKIKKEKKPQCPPKRVIQYSLDGEQIAIFPSIGQANKWLLENSGMTSADVGRVCRNERKTCGGFIWRFE